MSTDVAHNERLYSNLPLIVFGALTLSGCGFITIAKLSGVSIWVACGVPILLMVLYWIIAASTSAARLHDEAVGDNLYYMGFLFTLTSLGVALYMFAGTDSTDDVVKNFGVAISSTIVGVALRILYNQSRRDIQSIDRATRHDMANAARRVRAELEATAQEFAHLRRVNNQLINEGFEAIVEQVRETTEKLNESSQQLVDKTLAPLAGVADKFIQSLETSLSAINSNMSTVANEMDSAKQNLVQSNSELTVSTKSLSTHVDKVAKKLEKIEVPNELIKDEFGPLVKQLDRILQDNTAAQNAKTAEQAGRIDELTRLVTSMGEVLQSTLSRTTAQQENFERVVTALDAFEQRQNLVAQQQLAAAEMVAATITSSEGAKVVAGEEAAAEKGKWWRRGR